MSETNLGPIATAVLYEDEQIRIWDQRIAPGEQTAAHMHDHDYVLVDIAGDRIGVEPLPGSQGAFTEHIELRVLSGQTYTVKKGSIEIAENIGKTPYRAILIELKNADFTAPTV